MSEQDVSTHVLAPGVTGAPLVVFVHGLEDIWACWKPMAAELDPDWRLIALDLPWRAGNDYRWRAQSAGHWLGRALDLIGEIPALVVAHSYGANATLELLSALDPRPGRAAVLLCPVCRHPSQPVTWGTFERSRATFIQHVRDGLLVRMGPRAGAMPPDVLETMLDVAVNRIGPAGFLAVFEQFTNSVHLPAGDIGVPALLVAGGADPTLSPEAATDLGARIPRAEVRVNPGYDHFCHVRHARDIAMHIAKQVVAQDATPTAGGLL